MTIAVVLILGVLWVAVLVPPILRARGQQGRSDSVGDFTYRLSTLGHANGSHRTRHQGLSPQHPMFAPTGPMPGSMSAAQKRRRDVLFVLFGAAVVTLLLAGATRMTSVIVLHLLVDIALGSYVYMLIQHKQRLREQQAKVRYLGAGYREPAPYYAARSGRAAHVSNGPRLVALRQTASN